MCLILFAWRNHPRYDLIVAANRDEFHERPTAAAEPWEEAPHVLAGRDLRSGGTWLGISTSGRFAAVTNYRDPASLKTDAPSRGGLASEFLLGAEPPGAYLDRIAPSADRYNGFSLLVGDRDSLHYYSNRGGTLELKTGIYGLSNRLLDTDWEKVTGGKKDFAGALAGKEPDVEDIFRVLADRRPAPDDRLPDTGVGTEWERLLSSRFIASPQYGTRSSTVVLVDGNGRIRFIERSFDAQAKPWMTVDLTAEISGPAAGGKGKRRVSS